MPDTDGALQCPIIGGVVGVPVRAGVLIPSIFGRTQDDWKKSALSVYGRGGIFASRMTSGGNLRRLKETGGKSIPQSGMVLARSREDLGLD